MYPTTKPKVIKCTRTNKINSKTILFYYNKIIPVATFKCFKLLKFSYSKAVHNYVINTYLFIYCLQFNLKL